MNTYKKYCTNVFVAQCEQEYNKGDIVRVTTKYGKENEHIVHNFVGYAGTKENPMYLYSITRADGLDNRDKAKNKVNKLNSWADSAKKRSSDWMEKSNEGKEFLSLAEPIKVGHHSEKRHRALLERNQKRVSNAMSELDKAESYKNKTEYWEKMAEKIDLSMPESLEHFKFKLEKAKEYHKFLKGNPTERPHSMSLSYAKKKVNEINKNLEIAKKLWS